MKLRISRTAALPAAFAAAVARVFIGLALDAGSFHNGVWIAALLGMLPAIPYLLCAEAITAGNLSRGPIYLLLAIAVLDAAQVLSTVVRVSSYLALEHVPVPALTLPVALAMLWCVTRNGDAVGYAATLWIRIFSALLLLVALLQMRHYHAAWLFPLLGNGWGDIARDGLRTSGCFMPATAVMLICDGESDSQGRHDGCTRLAMAFPVSALLLVLRLMMAPTVALSMPWLTRLDALLTNGRAPLYLQLPMILAFYAGTMHLLACEGFAASALLQRLVPALDGRACVVIVVLTCVGLSLSGIVGRITDIAAPWLFPVSAAAIAMALLLRHIPKGGKPTCES